jgi:hypothetical protein
MEEWGWKQKRSKKDWLIYVWKDGTKVEVRPGDYHNGNLASTFKEVYMITAGSAEAFWAGPQKEKPKAVPEEEPVTQNHSKEPTVEPIETQAKDDGQSTRHSGASSVLLDLLLERKGSPVSNAAAAKATGLPPDVCSNSMAYLANRGLAVRVKRGTYAVARNLLQSDVHHDVHHTSDHPSVAQKVPKRQEPPKLEVVHNDDDDDDDDIETHDEIIEVMLDLMAHDGFTAKHLALIAQWTETTKRLLVALDD